ncbi:Uncharacterized protein SCF082_LOCUS38717 [Durusdinium trenchii]|uniref:Major facilitator superfamily (MFS) profile domain-containing protein n=1 Tax=Durusdinium trenchii TaxID=1381693 RepID=A0ABP0PZV1_9DINO
MGYIYIEWGNRYSEDNCEHLSALGPLVQAEVRTYLILTLCWVSIVVVNLLEQPYARSLIHCDVPVNTTEGAEFSGSMYCGNRLHVINVGAHVSGKGQSLENVGRILITLFVSGFADYGRKRAALLGQFLITLSTALFAIAMFLPSGLAIPTYIVAQGLQGMSGIGILDQIVTGDVALILNDSVAVYSRKGIVSAMIMALLIPIIVYVQYAEITDFTWVWSGIVGLNSVAMALIYLFFPETLNKKQNDDKKEKENLSIIGVAKDEVKTFKKIITTHPYVGYRLGEEFLVKMADASAIGMPFLMAQFHFSQFDALVYNFVPGLVGGVLLGGLVAKWCGQYGTRRVWRNSFFYHRSTSIANAFLMPVAIFGIPYPLVAGLVHLPLAGFPALIQAVEIRLVGQETNAKFQAMSQLMSFFSGAITSWLYSQIFYGEARSYFRVVAPYALSAFFMLLNIVPFLLKTGPMQMNECDRLDQEAAAWLKNG